MPTTTETKPTVDKQFSRRALVAEQGRRKNNKKRARAGLPKTKAASWVFPGMGTDDIKSVLTGGTVAVEFDKQIVNVSLTD